MPALTEMVRFNPAIKIQVNVVSRSPHVVAFKLWKQLPGQADWTTIFVGRTDDNIPDHVEIDPVPAHTHVAWWVGVGGNAKTRYRTIVAFAQDGRLLDGGTCVEEGKVDDTGVAFREGKIVLRPLEEAK